MEVVECIIRVCGCGGGGGGRMGQAGMVGLYCSKGSFLPVSELL